MKTFFRTISLRIKEEEEKLSLTPDHVVKESRNMIIYLNEVLQKLKEYVVNHDFEDEEEEIEFFREIKPMVTGRLLYYNKLYRIETARPLELGKIGRKYFSTMLSKLESDYIDNLSGCDFYQYYRSGRMDKDREYFVRGNIDLHRGLRSRVFEIDLRFSTYYDYEVASIFEFDFLYEYLHFRINCMVSKPGEAPFQGIEVNKFLWTESKNALIELIYALHASQSIGHGKIGIRQIASLFQVLFGIQLGDIHHAFHRMKYRLDESPYLNRLISGLRKYRAEYP